MSFFTTLPTRGTVRTDIGIHRNSKRERFVSFLSFLLEVNITDPNKKYLPFKGGICLYISTGPIIFWHRTVRCIGRVVTDIPLRRTNLDKNNKTLDYAGQSGVKVKIKSKITVDNAGLSSFQQGRCFLRL